MSVDNPVVAQVNPTVNQSGVVLRQPIRVYFTGPSLIDPRSFSTRTFAVYGPGDVVTDTGAGTILNSGFVNDYQLIDGVVERDRVPGDYNIYLSGASGFTTLTASGYIGTSQTVLCEFVPSVPFNAETQYTAVLVGDDESNLLFGSGRYLGVTSWTSNAEFSLTSGAATSGGLIVETSYDRILPTSEYISATGYNDTYHVTITSVDTDGIPTFSWSKASGGSYSGQGLGIHDLGNNLTFSFSGTIAANQKYSLDVYIPKPLEETYTWQFTTAQLNAVSPPATPTPGNVVIDNTGGGLVVTTYDETPLQLMRTWPENYEYAVVSGLPLIVLEFNKVLRDDLVTSGIITTEDFPINIQPLAGMPNVVSNQGTIYPSGVEVSGKYIKLWL